MELLCVTGTGAEDLLCSSKTSVGGLNDITETLAGEIAAIKLAFSNSLVVVCGDLNGQAIEAAFHVDGDFEELKTCPTRGGNTLDWIFKTARIW